MKAMTTNDKCSAVKGLAHIFNTDGVEREYLDPAEVRSNLDFVIEKRPSFDSEGRQIPGHYHLVRNDTGAFIPSTGIGKKFTAVQHFTVFDYIVNDIMPKVPEMSLEAVGTIHGCGTGIITATMGSAFSITGDESPNTTRLFFSNPCNGYGSLTIGFTTVRLFCQNQIPAAVKQAKNNDGIQIRHTQNANFYLDNALEVIAKNIERTRDIRMKSEQMAKININSQFIKRMLDKIYPYRYDEETRGYTINENRREEVIKQFEEGETAQTIKGDTAWKLFNSFTYPIFNPTSKSKNIDAAEIAYQGALGLRGMKVANMFNNFYYEAMSFAA